MKIPFTRRFALCATLLALTGVFSTTQAAEWWMISSQQGEQHWNSLGGSASFRYWANSPSVSTWNPDTDWDEGTQQYTWDSRYAKTMNASDTYYVRGTSTATKALRTAGNTNSANFAFQGGKLVLENQYSQLLVRTSVANVSTVADFESRGGEIRTSVANNTVHNLSIGTFRVTGEVATRFSGASGDTNRTHNVTIGTLVGEGGIAFSSESATQKYTFSIGNASAYTGNFLLTSGELTFTSSFSTAGSLTLTSGTFHLTNNITVSALTVSGTALGTGTYSASDLTGYALAGLTIDGGASVIVSAIPEPAHAAFAFAAAALGFIGWRRRRR